MARFPVYLSRTRHRLYSETVVQHAERRLVRQSPEDRVIAVVIAPPGSRVRSRSDPNGPDQLVVPLSRSFLGRYFGSRVTIPAKYLIGDARHGSYGLALAESLAEAVPE